MDLGLGLDFWGGRWEIGFGVLGVLGSYSVGLRLCCRISGWAWEEGMVVKCCFNSVSVGTNGFCVASFKV